jgi:hypothetical protein
MPGRTERVGLGRHRPGGSGIGGSANHRVSPGITIPTDHYQLGAVGRRGDANAQIESSWVGCLKSSGRRSRSRYRGARENTRECRTPPPVWRHRPMTRRNSSSRKEQWSPSKWIRHLSRRKSGPGCRLRPRLWSHPRTTRWNATIWRASWSRPSLGRAHGHRHRIGSPGVRQNSSNFGNRACLLGISD